MKSRRLRRRLAGAAGRPRRGIRQSFATSPTNVRHHSGSPNCRMESDPVIGSILGHSRLTLRAGICRCDVRHAAQSSPTHGEEKVAQRQSPFSEGCLFFSGLFQDLFYCDATCLPGNIFRGDRFSGPPHLCGRRLISPLPSSRILTCGITRWLDPAHASAHRPPSPQAV